MELLIIFFVLLAKFFQFKALAAIDVSIVSSMSALTPVLAIFSSWFFLKEIPSFLGWIGVIIISLSIFFIRI